MRQVEVKDLKPLQGPAHSAPRPGLQRLTDAELLEAVRNPAKGTFSQRTLGRERWLTAAAVPTNCSAVPPTRTAVSSPTQAFPSSPTPQMRPCSPMWIEP
jgi:hypothetical protein